MFTCERCASGQKADKSSSPRVIAMAPGGLSFGRSGSRWGGWGGGSEVGLTKSRNNRRLRVLAAGSGSAAAFVLTKSCRGTVYGKLMSITSNVRRPKIIMWHQNDTSHHRERRSGRKAFPKRFMEQSQKPVKMTSKLQHKMPRVLPMWRQTCVPKRKQAGEIIPPSLLPRWTRTKG